MKNMDNLGRWFVGVACTAETLFFGCLVYTLFGFDRMFYGHYVSGNSVFFGFMALLGIYSSAAILRSYPNAHVCCAFLFLVTISRLVGDAVRSYPPAWSEFVWIALPVLGLSTLFYGWMKRNSWLMRPTQ